jgi:endonuclease/exonuclease/phosphatase (EEP) superfamily protein YafD
MLRLIVTLRAMRWRLWLDKTALVAMWALAVGCLAFAVIRVFGLEHKWTGYTLIAFTPYAAIVSVVPLIWALAWRRTAAAIVTLATTVTFACVLVPRLIGGADPARGPMLRVMSTNMKIGAADPATIVRLATDSHVDVLAIQEFTPQAQAELLADGLSTLMPYSELDALPGASGSGIFSRYPLTDTGVVHSSAGFNQAYATVNVPGAQAIYVRSVHPRAPTMTSVIPYWHRDLANEPPAAPDGQVRVLIGDFNATLDHAILRNLIGTGYHDAAAEMGDGSVPTWPYDGRFVPRVTLDHVLVDHRVGVSSFAAHQVAGTDHRSIIATLTLPPPAS